MKPLVPSILVALAAWGCVTLPHSPELPSADPVTPRHVRVRLVEDGITVVREVPLEAYVHATAISEFAPASGDPVTVGRMFDLQAIISRTYAISHLGRHANEGFDLCATTHCQLFDPARTRTSRWSAAGSQAIDRTAGVVLRFGGKPAQALFHADCGGHTSESAAVWGGANRPYLVSHADDGVADNAHERWEYKATVGALTKALNADSRTQVGTRLIGIEIVARDGAGRATRIAIRNQPQLIGTSVSGAAEVRGEELRHVLARAFGVRSIRSTWFDLSWDRTSVVFSGRGFGHGVGLCQAGALARLRAGATPEEVLRYYYPGTTLESIGRAGEGL
jgi:stage II sporulation protein D